MRHIDPRIGAIVEGMAADGVDQFVAIALAPQRSSNAAGYRRAVEAGLAKLGAGAPVCVHVDSWHDEPRFIEALATATLEAIGRFEAPERVRVVFTAHSLPARVLTEGDQYPHEVARTAALVAERIGGRAFDVAFQSAGRTDEPWLGPDLRDEIDRLARLGARDLVVCPVGFVADHLEILYDIDIEAQTVARRGRRSTRTGSFHERRPDLHRGAG